MHAFVCVGRVGGLIEATETCILKTSGDWVRLGPAVFRSLTQKPTPPKISVCMCVWREGVSPFSPVSVRRRKQQQGILGVQQTLHLCGWRTHAVGCRGVRSDSVGVECMCVCGRSAGGYLGGQMDEPHSIFFVLLGQRRGVKQDAGVMRLCGTKMDANGAFLRLVLCCLLSQRPKQQACGQCLEMEVFSLSWPE